MAGELNQYRMATCLNKHGRDANLIKPYQACIHIISTQIEYQNPVASVSKPYNSVKRLEQQHGLFSLIHSKFTKTTHK